MPARLRNFVLTINNPVDDDIANVKSLKPKFAIGAFETGESGTRHIQAYVELPDQMSFNVVKDILKSRGHIEPRKGSQSQAENYCRKGEQPHAEWQSQGTAGPNFGKNFELAFQLGEKRAQGKRHDLDSIIEDLASGKRMRDVAESNPIEFIKYAKGIEAYRGMTAPERDHTRPLTVEVYYGPTGTGKTYKAVCDNPGAHKQSATMGGWWNGYDCNDVVIFDEYRGQIKFAEILQLTDVYPLRVQVKGGERQYVPDKIIFTSPVHPANWYPNINASEDGLISQLKRRISKILYFSARGETPVDHTDRDWSDFVGHHAPPPLARQFGTMNSPPQFVDTSEHFGAFA